MLLLHDLIPSNLLVKMEKAFKCEWSLSFSLFGLVLLQVEGSVLSACIARLRPKYTNYFSILVGVAILAFPPPSDFPPKLPTFAHIISSII